MFFENFKDIVYTNVIPKTKYENVQKIEQDILSLLPEYRCEALCTKPDKHNTVINVSKISFFSVNSVKAVMRIDINDKNDEFTLTARIKQNLFAAVFCVIFLSAFLLFLLSLIIMPETTEVLRFVLILFCIAAIFIIFCIFKMKDSNVTNLGNLYNEIVNNIITPQK